MTDLEMVKACAEAMGYRVSEWSHQTPAPSASEIPAFYGDGPVIHYDPLHDDAQAMALVKRFNFVIERDGWANAGKTEQFFGVTLFWRREPDARGFRKNETEVLRNAPDLNRAIVTCIAHMHLAKAGAREGEKT